MVVKFDKLVGRIKAILTLQKGVSLVELTVALSLFAVVAVGAFSALSVFDQQKKQQVEQKNTSENQRRDFLQAYNRILEFQDPTPLGEFGLAFYAIDQGMPDAEPCLLQLVSDDNSTIEVYSSSYTGSVGTTGCPDEMILDGAYQLSDDGARPVFFGIAGTGKICEGQFKDGSDFDDTAITKKLTLADKSCLTFPDGRVATTGDKILFPEYMIYDNPTSGGFGNDLEVSSAIFFPFDRLTQPTLAQCAVTSNVEFPITGFDIDGNAGHGSDDEVAFATVTLSGGFVADEDRLYIRNATDNDTANGRTFTVTTNGVGDIIHTYTNVKNASVSTFPTGITLSSATYNTSQGFMLLAASADIPVDKWEEVFDEIIYINRDNADMDPTTQYTAIDKQIIFSLGQYPARKVDGDYHFYNFEDCAAANCKTWPASFAEAKSDEKKHLKLRGYLATITSDEENTFVSDRARSQNGAVVTWAAGWLGATGWLEKTEADTLCPDVTTRGNKEWYWVSGKDGAEKCTRFWKGTGGGGQPIGVDGNAIPSSVIDPNSSTAWNCDNSIGPNQGNVIERLATSDNKHLLEAWWFDDRRGRDDSSVRYANWSAGSSASASCSFVDNTIGEPNHCCGRTIDGATVGEHFLQMTGLPSGARLWNDLHGQAYDDYNPGGWYEVRGYFIEWDTSKADPDAVLAREARLNTRRHKELCLPVLVNE